VNVHVWLFFTLLPQALIVSCVGADETVNADEEPLTEPVVAVRVVEVALYRISPEPVPTPDAKLTAPGRAAAWPFGEFAAPLHEIDLLPA
jgi:hypothetical protein